MGDSWLNKRPTPVPMKAQTTIVCQWDVAKAVNWGVKGDLTGCSARAKCGGEDFRNVHQLNCVVTN